MAGSNVAMGSDPLEVTHSLLMSSCFVLSFKNASVAGCAGFGVVIDNFIMLPLRRSFACN